MEEKQHDIIEVCRRRKEEFRLPLPVDGWERLEADLKELEKMQAMMENEDREDLAVYMQNIIKALQ